MQSLFETCVSQMTHKDVHAIRLLPTPRTVTSFLLEAKQSRKFFNRRYERHLGGIADKCFIFGPRGSIRITDTLANIEKCDLKQGFRFNCAFGKKERLAVIWKKLSDEDKAALRDDGLAIVQFYSTLTAGEEMPKAQHRQSFKEALQLEWHRAALNIYKAASVRTKKLCLFRAWFTAVSALSQKTRTRLCRLLVEMQEEREFEYDGEDGERYKRAIRGESVRPRVEDVEKCSEMCRMPEFEELFMEVFREQ